MVLRRIRLQIRLLTPRALQEAEAEEEEEETGNGGGGPAAAGETTGSGRNSISAR